MSAFKTAAAVVVAAGLALVPAFSASAAPGDNFTVDAPSFEVGESVAEHVLVDDNQANCNGGDWDDTTFTVTGLPAGVTAVRTSAGIELAGKPTGAGLDEYETDLTIKVYLVTDNDGTNDRCNDSDATTIVYPATVKDQSVTLVAKQAVDAKLAYSGFLQDGDEFVLEETGVDVPAGLKFDAAEGSLYGTPTTAGKTVHVFSLNGEEFTVTLTILPAGSALPGAGDGSALAETGVAAAPLAAGAAVFALLGALTVAARRRRA